jgi:hypothetical protein
MSRSGCSKAMSPRRTRSGLLISKEAEVGKENPPMVVVKEEVLDEFEEKFSTTEQVSMSPF